MAGLPSVKIVVMRGILVTLLFGSAIVLSACDPAASITFDNRTEHRLCRYESKKADPPQADPEHCDAVEPNERITSSGPVCRGDDLVWILITVGQGGDDIYTKQAMCEEWEGATVTIQRRDDEFVVTDTLREGISNP